MLKAGDLVFRQGSYHHTMLLSDPGSLESWAKYRQAKTPAMEVIHAASIHEAVFREQILIETAEEDGNTFRFYRPTDPRLKWALYFAKIWSRYRTGKAKETKGKLTRYSYNKVVDKIDQSRYYGAQELRHSGLSPSFEFDALYRSFKWATRQRRGFSNERGTTCCAFITACCQASAIAVLVGEQYPKMVQGYEILEALRDPKDPLRMQRFKEVGQSKKKVAQGSFREYANPGGYKKHLFNVNDYCRFVTKEILGKEQTVEQVFPSSLMVDAKYNYSANFEHMVKKDERCWTRVL